MERDSPEAPEAYRKRLAHLDNVERTLTNDLDEARVALNREKILFDERVASVPSGLPP